MRSRRTISGRPDAGFMDENTEMTDHWLEYLNSRETQNTAAEGPAMQCPADPEAPRERALDAWKQRVSGPVPFERPDGVPPAAPACGAPDANRGARPAFPWNIESWFPFKRSRKFR